MSLPAWCLHGEMSDGGAKPHGSCKDPFIVCLVLAQIRRGSHQTVSTEGPILSLSKHLELKTHFDLVILCTSTIKDKE